MAQKGSSEGVGVASREVAGSPFSKHGVSTVEVGEGPAGSSAEARGFLGEGDGFRPGFFFPSPRSCRTQQHHCSASLLRSSQRLAFLALLGRGFFRLLEGAPWERVQPKPVCSVRDHVATFSYVCKGGCCSGMPPSHLLARSLHAFFGGGEVRGSRAEAHQLLLWISYSVILSRARPFRPYCREQLFRTALFPKGLSLHASCVLFKTRGFLKLTILNLLVQVIQQPDALL